MIKELELIDQEKKERVGGEGSCHHTDEKKVRGDGPSHHTDEERVGEEGPRIRKNGSIFNKDE